MSVTTMSLVWSLDLPPNEKFVLMAYADHANHEGGSIFPAVKTIMQKTGYSERSVQLITRSLEQKGLLVADGKGKNGTNKWRIEGAKIAPADIAGVQPSAARGAKQRQKGVQPIAPEPSLTISEPSIAIAQEIFDRANAQVTATIENARSNGSRYPNREKIPETLVAFADVYNELTGQEPTKRVIMDWLSTLSDWLSEGVQPEHIRQAYKNSEGKFAVVRPGSLTNSAVALAAKGRITHSQKSFDPFASLKAYVERTAPNAPATD